MPEESSSAHCPFCADRFSGQVYAESGPFRAAYNIAPILPGHSLIIPKRHVPSIAELSDDEAGGLFTSAKGIAAVLQEAFKADGFDWVIQDGHAAGQTVPHLHIHLIPRKQGDFPNPGDWYPAFKRYDDVDSEDRPRLSEAEMRLIVGRLDGLF